ncbi:MAG: hydroxyethylthiazole kinase, partial [Coprobacillus sp.]
MIEECLKNLKKQTPLVHNITNYVTVNDCANILLACGGSPIMADDEAEVEEITSICGGLNINIGTLNSRTIQSMLKAGHKANELGHPVILDPVGAGASQLRSEIALRLLDEIQFTVIKGNISEIKTLALGSGKTQGVDASIDDVVTENNLEKTILFAKQLSLKTNAIIAITGAIDIVCNRQAAYIIKNGTAMLSRITGTGCM